MFNKITIIGSGLLGSSLLRAIRKKKISKKISVFDNSIKVRKKIKKLKLLCKLENNIKDSVKDSDLIILCSPISSYKKIIKNIKEKLENNSIIIDIASVKKKSIEIITKNIDTKNISWIPCHPIAGSEVSGPEYGSANLFENKWCIITPTKKEKKHHLKKIIKFWKKIGSKVKIMNQAKHDRIFSITSHMPHLIAYNLVKTAIDLEKKNNSSIIQFSGGGLRDFTRTASSSEIMWKDVSILNKSNILKSFKQFNKNLNKMSNFIKNENSNELKKIFRNTKKIRKKIISAKQDTSKPDFGR